MQDLFNLAEMLVASREEKKQLEAMTKDCNERIDALEGKMVEIMLENEVQNFNVGGHTFSLRNTVRASAKAGMQGELYEYLKDNGAGDLVKETVNANTLSSWVREQIEDNDGVLPHELGSYINLFEKTQISVRK